MPRSRTATLQPVDRAVVAAVLVLAAAGVAAVYSAIGFFAETRAGGDTESLLVAHVLRLALALGAAAAFSLVDYHRIARFSKAALVASLGLLVAVQLAGVTSGGAQRWLEIGPVSFQPSDFARVALILHLAVLLARKQPYVGQFERAYVPLALWAGATVVLIGMDNLSRAAMLAVTVAAMMFVGRVRMLHLVGTAVVAVALAGMLLMASPQRAARVEAFLGVRLFQHTDEASVFSAQDEGYQAEQARIAFALGGLTGVGPGHSTQRDFLPAAHNDFILAIIAEEYGLIGATILLLMFVSLLLRGFLRVARGAPDPLGLLLAVGLTTAVVIEGFTNAAVASGLFPVTGLPMPFVSYGGSSMLTTGIMVGILLNISRHGPGEAVADEE